MSASVKLRHLDSKLSALKTQHQHLLSEREKEIAALLTSLDLAHLEDNILLGGLFFLKDKIIAKDPMVEAWRDAGDRFLRRKRAQTLPSPRKITASDPTYKSI